MARPMCFLEYATRRAMCTGPVGQAQVPLRSWLRGLGGVLHGRRRRGAYAHGAAHHRRSPDTATLAPEGRETLPRTRAIKGSSSALVKSLEELASVQRAETESLKKAGSRLSRACTPCSGRRSCQVGQQQNQGDGQDGLRLPRYRQPRRAAHTEMLRLQTDALGEVRKDRKERGCLGAVSIRASRIWAQFTSLKI